MKQDLKASFSAADYFPVKLLHSDVIQEILEHHRIRPLHVQFIPTNRCNLHCGFCSCAEEDRQIEMTKQDAFDAIDLFSKLGTQAVTITGGGDPLEHPDIEEIILRFVQSDIKVGLVTNGIKLHQLDKYILSQITWCRISHSDERKFGGVYSDRLHEVVTRTPSVDWAFSYVVTDKPNVQMIYDLIDFANSLNFSHVRLVADLLCPEKIDLDLIRKDLKLLYNVDDSKVIYQSRDTPKWGGPCFICYLKPVVAADGRVYTCCGAQYALGISSKRVSKRMPDELCLGHASELGEIMERSYLPFDGSICNRCYYTEYNRMLSNLFLDVKHVEFA